jgi:hypothetical protein
MRQETTDALKWLRPSNRDSPPDLICVYWGPNYQVPEGGNNSMSRKRPRAKAGSRIMVGAPLTSMHPHEDVQRPKIPDRKGTAQLTLYTYP